MASAHAGGGVQPQHRHPDPLQAEEHPAHRSRHDNGPVAYDDAVHRHREGQRGKGQVEVGGAFPHAIVVGGLGVFGMMGAGASIGLCDDTHDVEILCKTFESNRCEIGRAHEDNTRGIFHKCYYTILLIDF